LAAARGGGKIGLDDPAARHLSGLPAAWQSVSIRALLAHASGIPDYTRISSHEPARNYRPEELTARSASQAMPFQPGQTVAGSATDYLLLARIVEAAGGQPFEQFVRHNQLIASACVTPSSPMSSTAYAPKPWSWISCSTRSSSTQPSAPPRRRATRASPQAAARRGWVAARSGRRRCGERRRADGSGRKRVALSGREDFTDPSELVCRTLLANREGSTDGALARGHAVPAEPYSAAETRDRVSRIALEMRTRFTVREERPTD
jgi:hypothetical protein